MACGNFLLIVMSYFVKIDKSLNLIYFKSKKGDKHEHNRCYF